MNKKNFNGAHYIIHYIDGTEIWACKTCTYYLNQYHGDNILSVEFLPDIFRPIPLTVCEYHELSDDD